uniref:Uncharacterized protein n=1 Tax=Setaria viridis TaxID=4556 RepID=A0A4U6SZV3_SETVI|nr:hypothetical protein SEVIR_9G311950v2 [Setaria viridis]
MGRGAGSAVEIAREESWRKTTTEVGAPAAVITGHRPLRAALGQLTTRTTHTTTHTACTHRARPMHTPQERLESLNPRCAENAQYH